MNTTKLFSIAVILVAFSIVFNSCKKDEDNPPANTSQKVSFHLHTLAGSSAVAYGTTYTDASGRKFNLSDLRYYISNIVLIKNDGNELPISGKVLLASPAVHDYELGEVPVGSYKGFKFLLGLDSATNHSDPTSYPATNPLSIQSPSIHWSWNSGYIFMKIEGQVDTTIANTGSPNSDYFYHIGMDMFKRTIDFSTESFTVVSGSDYEIGLEFNIIDALNNVDMRTENATHTMDNMPLATKIADNWQNAFSIE